MGVQRGLARRKLNKNKFRAKRGYPHSLHVLSRIRQLKLNLAGFTIVEVMIVLGISSLMLVSAAGIFNGRRQATEFSQAVYDLQSQLQSWANSVSSASVPGLDQYTCQVNSSGSGPVLQNVTGVATNQPCIYLGQAIQLISNGGTTIYSYPVFGLRTVHSGGADSCQNSCIFPSNAGQANADLAVDSSGTPVLAETYNLINALTIKTAKASNTASENDLLTLYSSLQNSNTSGNDITVSSYQKTFTSNDVATLRSCIQSSTSPSCGGPASTTYVNNISLDLCLSDGARKAKLSLGGTAAGITTRLDMSGTNCPL